MTILIPFISGIPFGPSHVLIALFGFAGFLGSTWEEWHTGILYLGIVSGPTEGAWSLCLISLITGIYGSTEIWTVAREVPFLNISLPLSNVVLYTFFFGVLSTIRTSCLHVWRKSGFKALSHLLWPFFYFCQCWLLTRFSSEIMASKSEFYWFVFFAGLPTCLRVSLTIVAYVTKSSLPSPSPLEFLPAVLIVLASYGFEVSALMKAMTMVSLLAYSVAINLVVGDLCRFLDIYCLTIKRK
jgi:ethanolaminephosphotransferase